jgi:hypothetical protein
MTSANPSPAPSSETPPKKDKFSFNDEWGVPQPVEDELIPVLPFEEGFLPSSIRTWVKDVTERMSVSLDFTGPCALVTIAGIVGRRAFVFPKQFDKEWKEAITVSGLIIASSGELKTPTWKTFMTPVFAQDIAWRKENTELTLKYEADLESWEKNQKKLKALRESEPAPLKNTPTDSPEWKKYKQDREKWANEVEKCNPQESEPPEPPAARRCVLSDATPEAMHQIMEENPEGVLYYRDEMSSWVAELDKKDREVELGLFLAAMNGNDYYPVDRIGRGSVFAIMCASLFGGFQPETFKEFLSNSRNVATGLIPRFHFLIWPDKQRRKPVDRAADEKAKDRFAQIINTLSTLRAEAIELHFDEPAQVAFNAWLDALEDKINNEKNPGKQSHLAKYRGALPKIAGLLQLVDLVANGKTPSLLPGKHAIDLEHFEMGSKLMLYLESHMLRAYGCTRTAIRTAEIELGTRIKEGALKDGFATRDVYRKHWVGLSDKDTVEIVLENLEEKGWVRSRTSAAPANGGWPTKRWDINPRITSDRRAVAA